MSDKCGKCDSTLTTHYATQGNTQIGAPEGIALNWSAASQPVFYGPLCDLHAREAGLMPSAFFRDLDEKANVSEEAK